MLNLYRTPPEKIASGDTSVWDLGVSLYPEGAVIWVNGKATTLKTHSKRKIMRHARLRLTLET